MIISEVKDRNESLINELVDVWERCRCVGAFR